MQQEIASVQNSQTIFVIMKMMMKMIRLNEIISKFSVHFAHTEKKL